MLDLKLGTSVISLFALLNKVAGVYGILAVFTGGTLSQVSLYLYSLGTIFALVWGLRKAREEHPASTLTYAHLFALDHVINTLYIAFFAVDWYLYVPHDGRRVANSEAQKQMLSEGNFGDDESRKAAAQAIWKSERGFAAAVLVGGWLLKWYFIYCIYSYALHLRRGTYHKLAATRKVDQAQATGPFPTRHGYAHVRTTSVGQPSSNDPSSGDTLWSAADEADTSDLAGDSRIKNILGRLSVDG